MMMRSLLFVVVVSLVAYGVAAESPFPDGSTPQDELDDTLPPIPLKKVRHPTHTPPHTPQPTLLSHPHTDNNTCSTPR